MSARSLSNISVAVLLFCGLLAVRMRYSARSAQQQAESLSRWRVTYDIDFNVPASETETEARTALGAQSEIRFALPFETPFVQMARSDFSHAGLPCPPNATSTDTDP